MNRTSPPPDVSTPPPREDARRIAFWTRRYVSNRTLPFLFQAFVLAAAVLAIGALSLLLGWAWFRDRMIVFALASVAMIAAICGVVWLSIPSRGAKTIWRIGERLYGAEGEARGFDPARMRRGRLFYLVGILYMASILTHALLMAGGFTSLQFAQPVSAIYILPFVGFLAVRQNLGFWPWLFIALYAGHAALTLLGVPFVQFDGPTAILQYGIVVFGYMLFSMAAGHFYSRFALRRLKSLAASSALTDPPARIQEPRS